MSDRRFDLLEAMRGLAALWVVMHHANLRTTAFIGPVPGSEAVASGFLGVDFFFVLSGFIIAYSSARLRAAGKGLSAYFSARLIRIYVPYLPIGIGLYLLYLMLPGMSASERAPGLITSFTLLPTNSPPALSVAWTLVHEMIFYCVYALYFFNARLLTAVLVAWSCAILATHFIALEMPMAMAYFLSPLNLCFLLGICAYKVKDTPLSVNMVDTLIAAGVLLVASVAANVVPYRAIAAIGFVLLVIAASSEHLKHLEIPKVFMLLGASSYAIYLVHNPLISIALRVVRMMLPQINPWAALWLAAAVATLAGVAYWALYEKKALKLVRSHLLRKHSVVGQAAKPA
jgi:exopolysaccharide production protein ExoZ